jgi:hypothetical protein
MGVVVNFDERTVSFLGYVAPTMRVDAATVGFDGEKCRDRVTLSDHLHSLMKSNEGA